MSEQLVVGKRYKITKGRFPFDVKTAIYKGTTTSGGDEWENGSKKINMLNCTYEVEELTEQDIKAEARAEVVALIRESVEKEISDDIKFYYSKEKFEKILSDVEGGK